MKFCKNMNLSMKFIPAILFGTLASVAVGGFMIISEVIDGSALQTTIAEKSAKVEQRHAHSSLIKALSSKARVMGSFIAKVSPDIILSYDFTGLRAFQDEASKDSDIIYTGFLKPDGKPMIPYKKPKDLSTIMEKRYPIKNGKDILGYVVLGMSKKSIDLGTATSAKRTMTAISNIHKAADNTMSTLSQIIVVTTITMIAVITGLLILLFRLNVLKPLRETTAIIQELAEGNGDLTVRLPVRGNDEIDQLRKNVNDFIGSLHEMISAIAGESVELRDEAGILNGYSNELAEQSQQQRDQTNQVATAMNEMTATVQEVARNVAEAADAASQGQHEAETGRQIVSKTVDSIHHLSEQVQSAATVISDLSRSSEKIGSVLDVIKGIAEQTNLLALNAAIEAARAGDQGRGFAVVADEVRTLASRTHESTLEIREMIETVQNGSANAVNVMDAGQQAASESVEHAEKAGDSLDSLNKVVQSINKMTMQIASAAEEQSATAEEINSSVERIHSISEQSSLGAEQTASGTSNMSDLAGRLNQLVGQFKL